MYVIQLSSLYKLHKQFQNASNCVEKTVSGIFIVPGSLDPNLNVFGAQIMA